jgi:hypothetical protein
MLVVFTGYVIGISFLLLAVLKPIVPANVGLFVVDGIPRSFGALFPPPAGAEVVGGYWVIPICLVLGLGARGAPTLVVREPGPTR